MEHAGARVTKSMTKGCVQGSTCGPILWNIILDELLDLPLPPGCHIQAFADDVFLTITAKNVEEIEHHTNSALDTIVKWGRSVKLEFGPSKTKVISFTPRCKRAIIKIDNHNLIFDKEIKYLGLIIDENLTFTSHVHFIINKASRIFNKLCLYTRPTWGAHPENIRTIHNQVITPIITYAAGIWGHIAHKLYIKNDLQRLQRGFAIKAIKAFRTVSTTAALALAQFTPFDLKILEQHAIETTRLTGASPIIPNNIPLERPTPPGKLLHPALRINTEISKLSNQEEIVQICPPHACQIYTDGSKQENGAVGAAFVCWDPHTNRSTPKKYKLHHTCTVFQAELFAIAEACNWARNKKFISTYIFSDSLSSIQAIHNRSNTHPLVTKIHYIIHSHRDIGEIKILWVKSHIGITGNETADSLANSAATLHRSPDYAYFPLSHIKQQIRLRHRQSWERRYQSAPQGSHTRSLLPTLDSVDNLWSAAKTSFQFTQYLTGHGFHKSYLYRFKIADNEACPCDDTTAQTFDHLIKDCPRFQNYRLDHKLLCRCLKVSPYSLPELLSKKSALDSFTKFITYIVDHLKAFNNPNP
ncbi:uncharacterized protein LOC123722730 [Papilio machaon]|uniref:uncharacterized protein LOC123722730 n=1 Tax=Papilio machaon TaxID=76193 RepID=UPI001E665598|nr:uncharacterized protein LOC123722730 [Papilio machaon]